MASKRRLTNREFNKAAKLLPRIAEFTCEAARQLLVDNVPVKDIAEQTGQKRQAIERVAKKIYDKHLQESEGCPPGWISRKVHLPPGKMKEVKKMAKEELKKAHYK
ncbi:MAG: transcriptional regulator KorA [Gammaproteobacteria bacterium]|nr:transcriptional regulator KorA [Gammaproteobacteria bacterium]